jgi:hypothetical protein
LIHQRHLTPSCGGHAPTAERTLDPARMITHESLTPDPELENSIDPKRAWAFNDRGFAYYLKGDPDSAFADFEQVIFAWVFPYSDLSRGLKIPCFPDGFRDTAGCCSAR